MTQRSSKLLQIGSACCAPAMLRVSDPPGCIPRGSASFGLSSCNRAIARLPRPLPSVGKSLDARLCKWQDGPNHSLC